MVWICTLNSIYIYIIVTLAGSDTRVEEEGRRGQVRRRGRIIEGTTLFKEN